MVCVMAILLVTVIYWQMSDFYRYPTVTSVNVNYVTEGDFPAVTICDLNMFNKYVKREMWHVGGGGTYNSVCVCVRARARVCVCVCMLSLIHI